jgi:hypothetical protein
MNMAIPLYRSNFTEFCLVLDERRALSLLSWNKVATCNINRYIRYVSCMCLFKIDERTREVFQLIEHEP